MSDETGKKSFTILLTSEWRKKLFSSLLLSPNSIFACWVFDCTHTQPVQFWRWFNHTSTLEPLGTPLQMGVGWGRNSQCNVSTISIVVQGLLVGTQAASFQHSLGRCGWKWFVTSWCFSFESRKFDVSPVDKEIKVLSDENTELKHSPFIKPGVGQYIAIHATLIDRDFFLA